MVCGKGLSEAVGRIGGRGYMDISYDVSGDSFANTMVDDGIVLF